jgi:hypothetical protein
VGLPKAWRGLNAGACTPPPLLVCPQLRLLKPSSACTPVLSSRPPRRPRRPPSVQSPFAQLGCYLRWGDVVRLLGEHYLSVIAHTGSFAAPVGLPPPSAFGLVRRVLAGCHQSLLPTAASRRYSGSLFLDAGSLTPAVPPCAHACFFHGVIGLPHEVIGSASRVYPANDDFSQDDFRGCRYFVMFRPPSLLAPRIVPTAASTAAGQLGLLHPGRACFVASARTGYANRPNTGNWRYRDLHPARLPALSAAPTSFIVVPRKNKRLRLSSN